VDLVEVDLAFLRELHGQLDRPIVGLGDDFLRIRSPRSRKARWPKVRSVVVRRAEKTTAARTRLRRVCGREHSMGLERLISAIG
jgi:hypothetical protein